MKFVYRVEKKGEYGYTLDLFTTQEEAIKQRKLYIELGRYKAEDIEILPILLKEKVYNVG